MEQKTFTFYEIMSRIKLGTAIFLIIGGCYLGFETFTMIKSILNEPTSLRKWIDLRPSIMVEPKEPNLPLKANATNKSLPETVEPKTLWVFMGYFALLLGVLYYYLLVRISLALLTNGILLLTSNPKKETESKKP